MSFWSWSSERAAKIPVSADPGFEKRYSTPASFRVWTSNMPPVPVMVLRMASLSLTSTDWELPARRLARLARDLVAGPRPRRRVRRLIAHEPAIALPIEQPENLLEHYAAPNGRQPVDRHPRP